MIGATERGAPVGRDAPVEHGVLLARRLEPSRRALPGMAAEHAWPLSLGPRFTRVCLDAARPRDRSLHEAVRRPATRHLSPDRLRRTVAVAEGVAADPARPPPPDRRGLRPRERPHR